MVNVVFVNYNSSEDTINCINSFLDSCSNSDDFKFYIFDNCSLENQKKVLEDYIFHKQNIVCYFSSINIGFAAANNYWMKKIANGEYIWILNNDTLVNKKLLDNIVSNLPAENSVTYFDCYTFENEFHDSGLHYINLLTGRSRMFYKSKFDFPYICGASFIIQKSENMPYFDESYFLYYEDADYGKRLKEKSFKFVKLENCFFNHKIGGSAKTKIQKQKVNKYNIRSQILFMKRYSICFPVFCLFKIIVFLLRRNFNSLKLFFIYIFQIKKSSDFSVSFSEI